MLSPHVSAPLAVVALCSAVVSGATTTVTAPAEKRTFNLPRGDAADTLKHFAAAAGTPIVYLVDRVRGTTTNAVAGEFTPRDALERMLTGSGLEAAQDAATGALVVSRKRLAEVVPSTGEVGRVSDPQSKPPKKPMKSPGTFLAAISGWLAIGSVAAQTTPTLPTGDTVQLSPFVVSTGSDSGYAAQSDVSGSRINTSLRDIGAPISVLTKELLDDIGAHSAIDAFAFMGNVAHDDLNGAASEINYSRPRVRGLSALDAVTVDFFPTYDDMDRYKLDRIGVSRGPNAILSGVGNPAGTLTSTAKSAGFKNETEIETFFTSWRGARATLDTNYVLAKNRVAVRAVLLQQDIKSAIQPQYKKDRRLFLAATAKLVDRPAFRTTLRGNYEWVQIDSLPGNWALTNDAVSDWIAAGRPLQDNGAVGVPVSTSRLGTQLVQIPGMATMNWTGNLATRSIVGTTPAFREDVIPYDVNVKGKDGVAPNRIHQGAIYLEQQIGQDLFLQAAIFHADENNFWPIKVVGATIQADPNRLLPNGQPNPNVGKFYVEHAGQTDTRFGQRDIERVQATYLFDFKRINPTLGKWLGRHQLFGLYEHQKNWSALERLQTVNTTPLSGFSTNLSNAANRVFHRSYLDYANGVYFFKTTPYREVVEGNGVRSVAMPVLLQTTGRTLVKSSTLAVQNRFWQDRLITTIGFRTDESRTYSAKPAQDAFGVYPLARNNPVTFDLATKFKPVTKSAVLHPLPLKWLSFTYSESENFNGGAATLKDFFGQNLPAAGGVGKDYGVRFYLFENKLTVSLNKFKSGSVNEQVSSINGQVTPINFIWEALNLPQKVILTGDGTRDTQDNLSEGYELALTFNPTRNWRLFITASRTSSQLSHLLPGLRAYLAENVPIWSRPENVNLNAGGLTVATRRDQIVSAAQTLFGQEGTQQYNQRLWSGSFVGAYTIHGGRLNGLSLSANCRFYGEATVGVPIVAGIADPAHAYKEKGYSVLGLQASYSHRLGKNYTWYGRLGVDNALDYDGHVIVLSRNGNNVPVNARWIEGASVTLTNGIRF